jgi:hypothetical protein
MRSECDSLAPSLHKLAAPPLCRGRTQPSRPRVCAQPSVGFIRQAGSCPARPNHPALGRSLGIALCDDIWAERYPIDPAAALHGATCSEPNGAGGGATPPYM